MIFIRHTTPSPFQKIMAAVIGLSALALGLAFSLLAIPVIALLGLLAVAYFHWKTRHLRRAMAEAEAMSAQPENDFIDGEAPVVNEAPDERQPR